VPARTSGTAKALISVVIVLVLARLAGGWSVGHTKHGGAPRRRWPEQVGGPSTAPATVLKPISATAADNPAGERRLDGSTTGWNSQFYIGNPAFGNLKKGSGLILNMATRSAQPGNVQFARPAARLRTLSRQFGQPASASGFTSVATTPSQASELRRSTSPAPPGTVVMIWFTSLPQMAGSPNQYRRVYNVVVRGFG